MISNLYPSIQITERDQKLICYLFEHKVALASQIRRDIFTNISRQFVHRRLEKLYKTGLIDKNFSRGLGYQLTYYLTLKSLKNFIANPKLFKRKQVRSANILHDLVLLDVHERLKKLTQVEKYISENVLTSGLIDDENLDVFRYLNPDALVKLKGQYIPVEYEANLKFSTRYRKIFHKYYSDLEVPFVLFISQNNYIEKKVRQAEKRYLDNTNFKFFYITVDKLIDSRDEVIFRNNKKEILTLN